MFVSANRYKADFGDFSKPCPPLKVRAGPVVVNGLIVLIAAKRHGLLDRWSQTTVAGSIGLVLTIVEIIGIDTLRALATGGAGWPV